MNALKLPNKDIVLGGYDWGATIALRMAAAYPAKVSKVVAFHPAWAPTKDTKAELAKIRAKTLVIWVTADMLHPWA